MSRSYKTPVIKDRPRNYKKSTYYWRRMRRVINQIVRSFIYSEEYYPEGIIPNPKQIINDYSYCDWIADYREIHCWSNLNIDKEQNEKDKIKYSRK